MIPEAVKIVEVGPRDGLQNAGKVLSTQIKAELIEGLVNCGLRAIEVGSLVAPSAVPQMADSEAVYARIEKGTGVEYIMLLANQRGLERAIAAGIRHLAVFCAASETFSHKNVACSIGESLKRIEAICSQAKAQNRVLRGYVSCVLGCPYEGRVALDRVSEVAVRLFELGCREISLGDTIGVGTPGMVRELIERIAQRIPLDHVAVHFHDTFGQALANVYAALESGVRIVDSSVGGLGGCPFAPGASGNLASEDLLFMLNGLGIETGVDLERLVETAWSISDRLNSRPASRVARAMRPKQRRALFFSS